MASRSRATARRVGREQAWAALMDFQRALQALVQLESALVDKQEARTLRLETLRLMSLSFQRLLVPFAVVSWPATPLGMREELRHWIERFGGVPGRGSTMRRVLAAYVQETESILANWAPRQ